MIKRIVNYVIGALCIIGGIFLIIEPVQSVSNAVYYVGIILLIIGIFGGISCIINKSLIGVNFGGNSFVLNIIFGTILIIFKDSAINFISNLFGFYLILSGAIGILMYVISSNRAFYAGSLVKNILCVLFGLILFMTPILTTILTGVFFGIIVILIGVYIIFSFKDDSPTYKVRVK